MKLSLAPCGSSVSCTSKLYPQVVTALTLIIPLGFLLLCISRLPFHLQSGLVSNFSGGERLLSSDKSSKVDYGPVVIVMSRGRSGSDFISRVVENIASAAHGVLADGLFGQKPSEMVKLKDPMTTLRNHLKEKRAKHPTNIIGFKWKPYYWSDQYENVLYWCGKKRFKILWNHRNPLDEYISHERHIAHKDEMLAHCYDSACTEKEKKLTVALNVTAAMNFVAERISVDTYIRGKLQEYNVDAMEVTYEELTYGTDQERVAVLQRINDFAVPAAVRRKVGIADLTTDTLITTDFHQRHTIENYDEIAALFTKHGYLDLLHP